MVITAVMAHRQRVLVRAFEQAAAVTAATARTPEQLGLTPGMAWHQLAAHAVLRCPGEGRYFLDQARWQQLRRRRRRIAVIVVVGLLALLALALLPTLRGAG